MRIIGGRWKGLRLTPVGKGDQGAHLRPTSDRVRESLFNLLMGGRFGDPVTDAVVLDLFAGTGALGLEALSRGAACVTFVENGRVGGQLLRKNITLTGATETQVLNADVTRLPVNAGEPASLVFLDPPYGKDLGAKSLTLAKAQGWIAGETLVVWEESAAQAAPVGFIALDQRRYGETWLTILEAA